MDLDETLIHSAYFTIDNPDLVFTVTTLANILFQRSKLKTKNSTSTVNVAPTSRNSSTMLVKTSKLLFLQLVSLITLIHFLTSLIQKHIFITDFTEKIAPTQANS